MFRDRVKEMAVNHPDMKASEILANVEMLMDNPGYNKFMKVHYRPIFEMSTVGIRILTNTVIFKENTFWNKQF